LLAFFGNEQREALPRFQGPSAWEPRDTQLPVELLELFRVDQDSTSKLQPSIAPTNMSLGEHRALEELQGNKEIILKPADKGGSVVIMDRGQYIREAMRQLEDPSYYLPLDSPIYEETAGSLLRRSRSTVFGESSSADPIIREVVEDKRIAPCVQTFCPFSVQASRLVKRNFDRIVGDTPWVSR
ncbi:hypothetical protein F7725_010587, partial [Dissostichus mawsoni]